MQDAGVLTGVLDPPRRRGDERQMEFGTLARYLIALHPDRPAHQLGQSLADRKPEPGATALAEWTRSASVSARLQSWPRRVLATSRSPRLSSSPARPSNATSPISLRKSVFGIAQSSPPGSLPQPEGSHGTAECAPAVGSSRTEVQSANFVPTPDSQRGRKGRSASLSHSGGGSRTPDTRMILDPPSRLVSVGLAFWLETAISAASPGRSFRLISVALVPTRFPP